MSNKDKRWYKYGSPAGDIYIKISNKVDLTGSGSILLKFLGPNDVEWSYHSPNKNFRDINHAVGWITRNTETQGTKFKILAFNNVNLPIS